MISFVSLDNWGEMTRKVEFEWLGRVFQLLVFFGGHPAAHRPRLR